MTSQDRECRATAGTSLAVGPSVPPAFDDSDIDPRGDAVWRTQRDQFFLSEARKSSIIMMALGGAVQLSLLFIMWLADYPPWRVCGLGVLYCGFAVAHRV